MSQKSNHQGKEEAHCRSRERGLADMRRQIGARAFDFLREVAVMAIVDRAPDSFFDEGAPFELDRAVAAALTAVRDGGDIVDVGGVAFGRGPAVSPHEIRQRHERAL